MRPLFRRSVPVIALLSLGLVASKGRLLAADEKPQKADFSGRWVLNAGLSDDPAEKMREGGGGGSTRGGREGGGGGFGGGMGGRGGFGGRGGGSRGGSGGARGGGGDQGGPPPGILEDSSRLKIADEGLNVRIKKDNGSERTLYTDGRKVEDARGEGTVTTKAKRKGDHGEKLAVTTEYPNGREVSEAWELLSSPHLLVITTKVSGRRSFSFKRVYEVEAEPPAPAATTTAGPGGG
jgi:hypothetical protein